MGIRQRRAGLQPAVTAQLKKKPSLSQCSTPQTAINLPVNLYDYIFDVPQGEDAIKSTEKVNTRGVRRGARDSGLLMCVRVYREKIMESHLAGIPMEQQVRIPTVPITVQDESVRSCSSRLLSRPSLA